MILFLKAMACIGLITFAGLCGVALGWLEKKSSEEDKNRDFW